VKPKKIKLNALKVASFITMTQDETKKAKGGDSYETYCIVSCIVDCDTLYHSVDLPCVTEQCQPGGGTGVSFCNHVSCPDQFVCA